MDLRGCRSMYRSIVLPDLHALAQRFQRHFLRTALHKDVILLLHRVARVREAESKLPIVGQQQQAAGVDIQPPNGIDAEAAHFRGQEIEHGRSALWIPGRTDITHGFMQHQVDMFARRHHFFTIGTHRITCGIDARTLRSHGHPIDLHAASCYQFFGMTTRSDAGMGQETRQPFTLLLFLLASWFLPHSFRSPTMHRLQRLSLQVCW